MIFKQPLLHALTRHIARDRWVVAALACDLVDLVHIDDAYGCTIHIPVGRMQKLHQDVLDILADVTRLGQPRGIRDGERHVQDLRQRARQ